jgi:CRP-like cAMP-binding protein
MAGFVKVLKQADIFFGLTPTQLELISNMCDERTYHKGETIFLEGTNSNELYIIVQGQVEILVTPSLANLHPANRPAPLIIAVLRKGQSFGEIALVDQGLRSATACAAQNQTRLLILPRDRLISTCETYSQMGYQLMRNLAVDLALKIRSTDLRIREELLYGQRTPPDQGSRRKNAWSEE